jgi:hypothetical protein
MKKVTSNRCLGTRFALSIEWIVGLGGRLAARALCRRPGFPLSEQEVSGMQSGEEGRAGICFAGAAGNSS